MDLELDGVSLAYRRTRKNILSNLNLKLDSEKIAVVGPNGSGKTTIIKGIIGLTEITSGSIRLFGEDIRNVSGMTGVASNLVDTYRILEAPARIIMETYCSMLNTEPEKIVSHLKKYEMLSILPKRLRELSTGQQKIFCNIMALEFGRRIALLDEPFETLDMQRRLMQLQDLKNFKGSILLNTHDFGALKSLPGFSMYIIIEGRLYGKFNSRDINRLYLTKGEVSQAISIIHTNYGTFCITMDEGDIPLSISTDLSDSIQEVIG